MQECLQPGARPIELAIFAPRQPSGFGGPTVLSRAVWCSTSALSLAPSRTTIIDTHIQVIKPMMAPSEPYVSLKLPKFAAYHENRAEAPSHMTAARAPPQVIHCHRGSVRLGPYR